MQFLMFFMSLVIYALVSGPPNELREAVGIIGASMFFCTGVMVFEIKKLKGNL